MNKNRAKLDVFSIFLPCFAIIEYTFLMLNAMEKKAKSIVTLSFLQWWNQGVPC